MNTTRAAIRLVLPAALGTALSLGAAGLTPASAQVVERFDADPLAGAGRNRFVTEGDVTAHFAYLAGEPEHFPADRDGTLRVIYDTTLPAARISMPIGQVLSLDADFDFGAILTIRSEGLFADPNGFSQIAFGLWNAATTGLDRTAFPSDSFDLVEFDYFPNVGSFGGPFLSPSVFGGNVGGNAFFNFSFQSVEVSLPLDRPLLCQLHYDAALRRLDLKVSRHQSGVNFERIPGAAVSVDVSRIDPAFLVDVAGIAAYFEGFPSLRATVDYDLLYVGPLPSPFGIISRRNAPGHGVRQED
ncbi:MAG: hypothetical protein AUH92_02800 [Acidobacteria bacterium 13_1_40CM_4_69_4]|nr:MAG: hypothetical protein AUH92_02800 [Acidobacteria bacterium 13_1_40CM_4_69_4]